MLIHGDCLEEMDRLIKDGVKVDAVITDPPYGTTACSWDEVIPFKEMWQRLNLIIKDNGAICLFGSEPFSSYLRISNIKNYKYDWIWNKVKSVGNLVAKYRPMQQTETISCFSMGKKINYYPITKKRPKPIKTKESKRAEQMGEKKDKAYRGLIDCWQPTNLIKFSNANRKNTFHPTQKPVTLMQYLIKTYTNKGDVVLDFTMGSGTTGVACIKEKREFIGIEKDTKYFNIAKQRIENEKKNLSLPL